MTTSNIADVSRHNGPSEHREKTPEEIQLEIAQTRSAITKDLLALSEKLSPAHLREGAREVMRDARDEAKEILRDAKDAAIGSLRDIKDRTVGRVSHGVSVIGDQARHASDVTLSFVSANAVAMSLAGLAAGLLLLGLRARRRLSAGEPAYTYEHYAYPDAEEPEPGRPPQPLGQAAIHPVDMEERAARTAARVEQRASELARRTEQRARHAMARTREIAGDHQLGVIAVTIAAGLGLGLLLPVGRRPRAAIRHAGERAWEGARRIRHDLGARAYEWR